MVVEFKENDSFDGVKDILIRSGTKLLKIFYGANGDLYFDIFGDRNIDENGQYTASFSIDRGSEFYQYFENFINSIIDCEIFDVSDVELGVCGCDDEVKNKLDFTKLMNDNLKSKKSYQKLVQNNTIIWYSDNIYDERANKLKIKQNSSDITLDFIDNPDDPLFGFGIRICNSGSKYEPFNICFMNLFNQLQTLNKESKPKKLVYNHTCK